MAHLYKACRRGRGTEETRRCTYLRDPLLSLRVYLLAAKFIEHTFLREVFSHRKSDLCV